MSRLFDLSLADFFASGKHSEILELTLDDPLWQKQKSDLPWIMGALVFLGKLDEAEALYQLIFAKGDTSAASADQAALAHFFLSLGHARVSAYPRASAEIRKIFHLRHSSSLARFCFWQASAFNWSLSSRYFRSRSSATFALKHSVLAGHPFFRLISLDLLGHAFVRTGEVSQGLAKFTEAQNLARKIGNGGFLESLEVSHLIFKVMHSADTSANITLLKTKLEKVKVEDNYTKASIGLELVRQLTLSGNLMEAEANLQSIRERIFRFGHRRQKATAFHRHAQILRLRGQWEECFSHLDQAEKELDFKKDLSQKLEISGLRLQVQKELSSVSRAELNPRIAALFKAHEKKHSLKSLEKEVLRLTQLTGSGVARSWWSRHKGQTSTASDDDVGTLLSQLLSFKREGQLQSAFDALLRAGALSLFPEFLCRPRGETALHLGFSRNVGIWEGNVFCLKGKLGSFSKAFLKLIEGGSPVGKKEVVESLWGFRYRPEIHDPKVYVLVSRVRASLGNLAHIVVHSDHVYKLGDRCLILDHAASRKSPAEVEILRKEELFSASFSGRQMRILEWSQTAPIVSSRAVCQEFGVSKATATRDLCELSNAGCFVPLGNGRGTEYRRKLDPFVSKLGKGT